MNARFVKGRMLDYCKLILMKMSFDRSLFRKEYRKTFAYLNEAEQQELKNWLRQNREVI
jgi:hypothetical protein